MFFMLSCAEISHAGDDVFPEVFLVTIGNVLLST